jgi:hypothetical protein
MLTVVVTNLTSSDLTLGELYVTLGPTGSSNASYTFTRTAAQLDMMDELKALLHAASVSVSITKASTDSDLMTLSIDQHGTSPALAVDAIAIVTSAVTFPKPFALGVTPKIQLTIVQGAVTDWAAQAYIRSVTNTGFTIALDVTDASATPATTATVNWSATY